MLNIHALERQWIRYKIKKYLPIAVISSGIFVLSIVGFIIWPLISSNNDTTGASTQNQASEKSHVPVDQSQNIQPENVTSASAQAQSSNLPINMAVVQHTVQNPATEAHTAEGIMEPSLGFIQNLEDDTAQYYETEQVPVEYSQINQVHSSVQAEPITTPVSISPIESGRMSEPVKAQERATLSITPTDAKDLADVIKRFQSNKSPALSLFLARRYYDLENYKESYDYALKTNEIDSNIEESWLIFSKSLVKLEQKDEAIKVLKSYINHSRSMEAKTLLDDITSGRFQ